MIVEPKAQVQPSFRARIAGWLPSLPSIPKIPSWNSCKEAFHSLTNRFRSSPTPLSERTAVDLTRPPAPVAAPKPEPAKKGSRRVMIAAAVLTCGAVYACFRYFQSHNSQSSNGQSSSQSVDLAVANSLAGSLAYAGKTLSQTLWSVIPLSLASAVSKVASANNNNCSVVGVEEVPLSQPFNTWDVFPFVDQGRLIASTTSPLPPGVSLVQSQMQIIGSIPLNNIQAVTVNQGNAIFLASTTTGTIQVYNIESLSNPYLSKAFDAGSVVQGMIKSGNQLFVTGVNTILKGYDISNPFNPRLLGAALNSSVTGYGIAASPSGNQFGCATYNGFFYVNGTNFQVTGVIPNLRSSTVASSEDCYFVGTNTGLVSVNATPSSTPISTLPTAQVASIIYENGYCLVATTSNFMVVDVHNPSAMKVVYTSSSPLISLLPSGNLLYYSNFGSGMGIIDKTNITNPVFAASGLFNQLSYPLLFPIENSGNIIIMSQGTSPSLNFITGQDSFSFSGTPQAGSKGNYPITLQATTLSGNVINETQACITIKPAITPISPIQKLISAVNQVFSAIIPANAFTHVLGLPMTYSLRCPSGNLTTNWINLNSVTGQFSGTPQKGGVGSATCVVQATDSFSASATSSPFEIQVTESPTIGAISNQLAIIGEPFSLYLNATSADPSSSLTFSISNLPPSFTYANGTISGTPTDQDLGTRLVSVKATDSDNISTTDTFTLNVVQPGVPVFLQPLPTQTVYTTNSFSFQIPPGTVVNQNNPNAKITYSASLTDGSRLPSWMTFDGTTFSGTPPITAKPYFDVTLNIVVSAAQILPNGQKVGPSSTFALIITGTAIGQLLLAILTSTVGAPAVIYRYRKVIYNHFIIKYPCVMSSINKIVSVFSCCHCCKPIRFPQNRGVFIEGQPLEYTFETPRDQLSRFKVSYDNELSPLEGILPDWLRVKRANGNLLTLFSERVPDLRGVNSIKVVAKRKNGCKTETVTFQKGAAEKFSPVNGHSAAASSPGNGHAAAAAEQASFALSALSGSPASPGAAPLHAVNDHSEVGAGSVRIELSPLPSGAVDDHKTPTPTP